MILILVCLISSLYGISGNPMTAFDQSILEMLKKPGFMGNKKFGQKFSLFGEVPAAPEVRPWNLQSLEMGKPIISRPFQPGVNPVMVNRFAMPQAGYNPLEANKMHIQPFAPFSDQKDTQQQPFITEPQKTENPRFPDPQGIAMSSFPGDINTAALHAMNLRNPAIPNFDMKSFMREQTPDHQRRIQQQIRDFGASNAELSSLRMMKKPEPDNMNDSFQMQKFNRPRENQGYAEVQDFNSFFPGRT